MWCLIFSILELDCTTRLFECLERCFPLKCNNIYSMGWFHLISSVTIGLACLLANAEHPRDEVFNKNWRKKDHQFDDVLEELPTISTRNEETALLLEMWEGMFKGNYDRGAYQPLFFYILLGIGLVNLILFALAVVVWVRNFKTGIRSKNEWPWYKGYPGFGFTFGIFLITLLLLGVTIVELEELVDTEMVYETYFPYCMRNKYFLHRFCVLSHEEISSDNDFCMDIKRAINNSYLCHNYYLKLKARILALIACVFHVFMCVGYAKMAYRPWSWKKRRQQLEEEDAQKERIVTMIEELQAKAPEKLKAAQERKAIKLVEIKRREEALRVERERLEKEIQIKNAKRRLHRRAEREERKHQETVTEEETDEPLE